LFKITAERVLSVLQRHKEVLVTLLDAFVYDPLFDWSTEVEENQKKQMMDLQANFGLLSNRLGNVSRYCLTQLEKETSASN
jgi:phosphatidylinositol kinase/protein kinase (PI-3  family)